MALIEFISIGFQLCDQRDTRQLDYLCGGAVAIVVVDPYFMIFKQFPEEIIFNVIPIFD